MGHRVELTGRDVAKAAVHRPCPHTLGNLLVATQRVAAVGIEVAVIVCIIGIGDVPVLVQLLKHLRLHGGHAGC